jgi:ferredoxin
MTWVSRQQCRPNGMPQGCSQAQHANSVAPRPRGSAQVHICHQGLGAARVVPALLYPTWPRQETARAASNSMTAHFGPEISPIFRNGMIRRGASYNFGCIRCDTCASLCQKNAPSAPNSFTVHDARGDFASCQYANHSEISKFQALKFCVASMTNCRTRGQQSGKRHAEAKQQLSACRSRGAPARFPSHRTGARRAWRYGRPQLREKRTQRAHQR